MWLSDYFNELLIEFEKVWNQSLESKYKYTFPIPWNVRNSHVMMKHIYKHTIKTNKKCELGFAFLLCYLLLKLKKLHYDIYKNWFHFYQISTYWHFVYDEVIIRSCSQNLKITF